jgi:hypothetical protein
MAVMMPIARFAALAAIVTLAACSSEPQVVARLVAPDGVTSAVVTEWSEGAGATGENHYRVSICRDAADSCTSIAHGEWMGVGYMQWFTVNNDRDPSRTIPAYRLRLGLQGGTADGRRNLKTSTGVDIKIAVIEDYGLINWDLGVYGEPRENNTWVQRSTAGPCYQGDMTGEERAGLRTASDRNPFRCPAAATAPGPRDAPERRP